MKTRPAPECEMCVLAHAKITQLARAGSCSRGCTRRSRAARTSTEAGKTSSHSETASVLVLAALLRLVQPREHEPARASWVIFAWARTHISHSGAGLVFIGLPGVAALILAAVLAHLIAD